MKLSALILLIIFAGLMIQNCSFGDNETYLIPKAYKGFVLIIFNQPDGAEIEDENGTRVYRIPSDGILKTRFSPNRGWHRLPKFFYVENGMRTEIPFRDYKELRNDSVQACCVSSGRTGRTPNDNSIEFDQFYVGTKQDIDAASEKANKLKVVDLLERQ